MSTTSARIHGLDALRATLMVAGIWLHSAMYYLGNIDLTHFDGVLTRLVLGSTFEYIHLFRMPHFFILSGFFSALLWVKRGPRSLLENRFKRIVVPFILFALVIGWVFGSLSGLEGRTQPIPIREALFYGLEDIPFWPERTMHLWFLYMLIYLNIGIVILAWMSSRLPLPWDALKTWGKRFFESPALSICGLLALDMSWRVSFQWKELPTSEDWLPDLDILTYYLGCFSLGWVIYHCNVDLLKATGGWIANTILGVLCTGYLSIRWLGHEWLDPLYRQDLWELEPLGLVTRLFIITGSSVAMLTIIRQVSGAFLRLFNRESVFWRYISDSAYWVYLVHLIPCIILPEIFNIPGVPALVQFTMTLVGVSVISWCSYDAVVRNHWLGQLLNGRRVPPMLPRLTGGVTIGTLVLTTGCIALAPLPADSPWLVEDPADVIEADRVEYVQSRNERTCLRADHRLICLSYIYVDKLAEFCDKEGATFPLEWTPSEVAWVSENLPELTEEPIWVPVDERAEEDAWRWFSGAPVSQTLFSEGEPNDWGGVDEDCVVANYGRNPRWVDVPCSIRAGIICHLPEDTP